MGIVGSVSVAALVVVVGYLAAEWALKVDTKVEDRRRAANRLAGVMRSLGLRQTPKFLEDYGVGDYSGMGDEIIRLVELFASGEEAVVAEFEKVFERCLDAKLATEEGRAYLGAKLTEMDVPT